MGARGPIEELNDIVRMAERTSTWIAEKDENWWAKHAPQAIFHSIRYHAEDGSNPIPHLDPKDCPKFQVPVLEDGALDGQDGYDEYDGYEFGARVLVTEKSAVDVALALSRDLGPNEPRVAVLNMGNPYAPGGNWRSSASETEEQLFQRTSLSKSLHQKYYPLERASGIYSPGVSIIRKSAKKKYALYTANFPTIAVLTVAAQIDPELCQKPQKNDKDYTPPGDYFANPDDAELLREKIRIALRMAAYHGHSRIVLGALGCGPLYNGPTARVAELFFHVFMEEEFTGGWWEYVVFSVPSSLGLKNYEVDVDDGWEVFSQKLHGLVV